MVETSQPVTREEVRKLLRQHYEPEESGLLQRQVKAWQRGCYGLIGGLLLAMGVIAVLAVQPKLIPYPIVYDPDGRIIWHGEAATTREERFIDMGLVDWVVYARATPSDETVFREYREKAGAMVHGKAAEKFATYNKETIAAYKDQQRRVLVKIDQQAITVIREGDHHVRISWPEIWTPEYGYGSETHWFQAVLSYAWYAQPEGFTQAQARLNPRRLYVTEYSWDKIRQGGR